MVNLPLPEVVYHYTSMENLLKIVISGCLHASNINYLNDISELRFYTSSVIQRLPDYRRLNGRPFKGLSKCLQDEPQRPFPWLPFVACFSADGDSLPQWRSYCRSGNGVSIGIRTVCLSKAVVSLPAGSSEIPVSTIPSVVFGKIAYPQDDDYSHLDDAILVLADMYSRRRFWQRFREDFTIKDLIWTYLYIKGCNIKHPSFSSENEYRLATNGLMDPLFIDYHASQTTLKPFVNIRIHPPEIASNERYQPTFIKEVIIGPTPHFQLSEQAVACFFLSRMLDVQVSVSSVPYRDLA